MATELKTIWVRQYEPGAPDQPDIDSIAAMLDAGWELVSWQPTSVTQRAPYNGDRRQPPVPPSYLLYDVFLLRKAG